MEAPSGNLAVPRPVLPLMVLLALALIVRAGALLVRADGLKKDPDGYRQVAEGLVAHGTFGRPTNRGTEDEIIPTARRPPLYPLLLTTCVPLGPAAPWGIGLLHLGLGLATVALMLKLGDQAGLAAWKYAAAGLLAFDPILLNQSTEVMTETLAALLSAALLLTLTSVSGTALAAGGSPLGPVASSAAAGVYCGLAVLCRPTFLPFVLLVALILVGSAWRRRPRWSVAGAFLAAGALVLTPWIVRNQAQFGHPIVTTTHGGHTLLLGNNPYFYEHLRTMPYAAPWSSSEFAADDRQVSPTATEWERDRADYERAWRNIWHDPPGFVQACSWRVTRLWGLAPLARSADESRAAQCLRYAIGTWYLAEFALAILGIWALRGSWFHDPWRWGLLLLLVFTAVHVIYWTDLRMRAPLIPVVALFAAVGLKQLVTRILRYKPEA